MYIGGAVSNTAKILIWKQITTGCLSFYIAYSCFQYCKDTNLKANHNCVGEGVYQGDAVSNTAKILIWKQITTYKLSCVCTVCCFQYCKDTNLKANHNSLSSCKPSISAVSNTAKILIWKQITTNMDFLCTRKSCFQYCKDTNLKANHNCRRRICGRQGLFPILQRY